MMVTGGLLSSRAGGDILMMGRAHVWIGLLFFKRLSLHLPTLLQWSSDGGWEYYGVSIPQKWI